jgi:hypothetical protein
VQVTMACVNETGCVVLLARNLRGEGLGTSPTSPTPVDEFFGSYTLTYGEGQIETSTVVWVLPGDSIAVFVEKGSANVTSVFAFEDSDSCAYKCSVDDYMRNGKCIRCKSVCAVDEYSTECFRDALDPTSDCLKCDTKPLHDNITAYPAYGHKPFDDTITLYDFKDGVECHWRCVDGHFWNTTAQVCQAVRTEPCSVGEYLRRYTRDEDSKCTPCVSTWFKEDPFRVFVTDGGVLLGGCKEECIDGKVLVSDLTCQQCDANRCGIGGERYTSQYMTTTSCETMQESYCVVCEPIPKNPDLVITASGVDICAYSCAKGLYQKPVCGNWDEHFPEKTVDIRTATTVNSSAAVYLPNPHEEPQNQTFVMGSVFRLKGKIRVAAHTINSIVRVWGRHHSTPLAEFKPRVSVLEYSEGSVWQEFSFDWESLDEIVTNNNLVYFELIDTYMELIEISMSSQTHGECSNDAYTCTDCGLVYTHPANASFTVSRQCEWSCDEGYERQDDVCIFCPVLSCITGEYMSDCGMCSACVENDGNAIFTSNGIRGIDSSCATRCKDGHFTSYDTGNCTKCSPLSPDECKHNSYFVGCSSTMDAHCEVCRPCGLGLYVETACHLSVDTVCATCVANLSATNSLPENGHWVKPSWDDALGYLILIEPCSWSCDTGYIHDEKNGVCKTCTETCGVGYYETQCTRKTEWNGCMPCMVPENAYAIGPGRQTLHSCPWTCGHGFSKDKVGGKCVQTTTTPGVVTEEFECDLTSDSCAAGEYLHSNSSQKLCICAPCGLLANASTLIAQFTTPGTCEWICINPYIRTADVCKSLKDMRMKQSLDSSGSTNTKLEPIVFIGSAIPVVFILIIVVAIFIFS